MTHLKSDKPQTKLGILNMAVEVIMQLEQQVRGTATQLPRAITCAHVFVSSCILSIVSAKTENTRESSVSLMTMWIFRGPFLYSKYRTFPPYLIFKMFIRFINAVHGLI